MRWPKCRVPSCDNAGRYSSGYCSLHDSELNAGKGTRVVLPVCAHCRGDMGEKYYQGVPNVGDLCLVCWKKWMEGDRQ